MADRISGEGGDPSVHSRADRKLYEAEYKQAADLFERSLNEYSKSDNMYQKEEFRKVMEKSLHILNDTAAELKRQDLLAQNNQIERDYDAFRSDETQASILKSDLEKAKKSI